MAASVEIMRFFLIAILCIAAVFADDEEILPSLTGMQALSISYNSPEELGLLREFTDISGFDFVGANENTVDILVSADRIDRFKEFLESYNLTYTVTIEDVEEKVMEEHMEQYIERTLHARSAEPHAAGKLPLNYYPTYSEVIGHLEYIKKSYPNVATLINIGKSHEGRSMVVLKLSTGGKNKPAIFIDAGIHAREWIAPVTALYAVELILTNNIDLLNEVDWYILPVLNPDGYDFTHSNPSNRLWRKTRITNPGSSCRGVDGNRNYDLGWMEAGASSNPCSETYAGPKPFSEPEMQNMRDFILARKDQIKAYLTFHSYGQYILYPWGYTTKLPPNERELRNLASECAKAIAKSRHTRYTYGTSANHLYPAAGGSDDWALGKAGINISFTIELPGGSGGFILPPSQIKPVGIETFEAIKVIHQTVLKKY